MEKPSYPPLSLWGGLPGALKKEPGPSCEGPDMIRPVVPGLGPDDEIRRSMVRISAHLALTRERLSWLPTQPEPAGGCEVVIGYVRGCWCVF
jgi:hypothetical protein